MCKVITAITPVTLFGQPIPCFANRRFIKSGDHIAAVIEVRDGGKFKTVEGSLSTAERTKVSRALRR